MRSPGRESALVPQGRRIFPSLTVAEHLDVFQRKAGDGRDWNLDRISELFPAFEKRMKQKASVLSGGEQQMLAIARALLTNPELLLMDEPSEGLRPSSSSEVVDVIGHLRARGLPILLVEQNLSLALRVSDQVHVLSRGRIVHSSAPQALWENEEIRRVSRAFDALRGKLF